MLAVQTQNIIPILQLIVSALGLTSLFLIWHQIKLATQWNKFKAHHDLLSYLPDEHLEMAALKALEAEGCERDVPVSRPLADRLYENATAFVTIKTFLNKYEHFCSAINVRAVDEEHAYSIHAGRVLFVFQLYREFINVARERRKSNSPYYELQTVAVRWGQRRTKQESELKNGIEKLTQDAEKTTRPVFK
jgi:Domain of unknown function (DUF4760)